MPEEPRLHIPPEIIPVIQNASARYAASIENDAPRLSTEDPHLISDMACACKKFKPAVDFPLYDTGQMQAFNTVCRGCEKQWAPFARIICKNCRIPAMFVLPHKDDKGFEFVKGRSYHVTVCPNCDPTAKAAIPVEKIWFDYKRSGSSLPVKEFARLVMGRGF